MRGLNLHKTAQPRQHLAGGGLVQGLKRAFGMDEERNARIAAYKASQAADAAAKPASTPAPAAAPAPAPAPAVSDYSGMGATQRREKALGLKNGGIVHGPGTGTSDDIPDEMREGSYVLPADTTAKTVGPQTNAMLNQMQAGAGGAPRGLPMGKKVPVQLSNGETKLTPEDVHAIGAQALDALKGATHTPVARGMPANIPGGQQDDTRMFFAEGGAVTEEERLRRAQLAQIPVGGQVAPAADGRDTTEFSRNANNALNAMGGMGAVASVPLRAAEAARGLPGAYQTLAAPVRAAAAPAADFIAGAGPNATAFANTIPRLTNSATPVLPAANVALQQGAQANVAAAGLRAAGGAGAGATALDANGNPTAAAAPPVVQPGAPSVLDTDPQARADRAAIAGAGQSVMDAAGNAGRAVADIASLPIRGVAGAIDSTVVRGLRAAGVNAPYISPGLVPQGVDPSSMTPFTDQARMQQPAAASPAATSPTAPSPQVAPADTQPVSAPMAVKSAVPPGPVGLDGVRPGDLPVVDQQVAPGVYRQGNSYGDSPAAAAAGAAPRGLPSAQNNAAAQALADRSQAESAGRVAAAPAARGIPGVQAGTVPNTGNNWQARNDMRNLEVTAASITNNGGRFDPTKGNNAAQAALKNAQAADLAARGAQPVLDRAAMDANANLQREQLQQQGGIDRENIQQGGANTRAARGLAVDRARLNVEASRAASENAARDVSTTGAQQLQQLRNVLLDPEATPEQRKQAESSLRAIGGKAEAANRFTVVPGGQEVSPQGVAFTRPSMVLNNQTGEIVGQNAPAAPQGGAARPASKAEYDALPKGTQYVGPDGKIKIKG